MFSASADDMFLIPFLMLFLLAREVHSASNGSLAWPVLLANSSVFNLDDELVEPGGDERQYVS